MLRKILFLINPISGTRSKKLLEKKIMNKCSTAGLAYEIMPTLKNGNYTFLKNKIKNEKITDIVICGGDGSIRPVIAAVMGIPVNIGIIPFGSGNGLAFSAKIPDSFDKAFDIVRQGKISRTDVFLVNDTLSCMLCGVGLDAQVALDFSLQKTRGLKTYIRQTLKNFIAAKPYHFELILDDFRLEAEAYFISIANSNQFGNNFIIAPEASLNDGLLDIVVVKKMSKTKTLWSLWQHLQKGKIDKTDSAKLVDKDILYFQAKKLQILNPQMAPMHIDGDYVPASREISIRIIHEAYNLIVP
jgi:diacylglycerol kinase (ATP)